MNVAFFNSDYETNNKQDLGREVVLTTLSEGNFFI